VRGRSLVALVLVGFVLVATGVIWRRSFGNARAREQQRLEQQRAALEAERAKVEGDIRDASSRATLAKVAEQRLNMHIPSDSLVIYLQRPSSVSAPAKKRTTRDPH
jgi:cell division protein FtsL